MTGISSRKLMHFLLGGGVSLTLAFFFPFFWRVGLAITAFLAMAIVEIIRQHRRYRAKIFLTWLTLGLARRYERRELTGAFWICLGLAIISFLPDKTILCLAIIPMGFGDPMAEIIGKRWPLLSYPNGKTLGGSSGFFFASFFLSFIFLETLSPMPYSLAISLLASLFATVVESSSKRLNDNFTVLVFTAAFLLILFRTFGQI